MGRVLKRVPLDFDYPIDEIWKGYDPSYSKDKISHWKEYEGTSICASCNQIHNNCDEEAVYCMFHPENKKIWKFEPPTGEGYQLWETTSEGSPQSPVFKTLDELCEWCEEYATTFGSYTTSKEEWKEMLDDGIVYHNDDNITFL